MSTTSADDTKTSQTKTNRGVASEINTYFHYNIQCAPEYILVVVQDFFHGNIVNFQSNVKIYTVHCSLKSQNLRLFQQSLKDTSAVNIINFRVLKLRKYWMQPSIL